MTFPFIDPLIILDINTFISQEAIFNDILHISDIYPSPACYNLLLISLIIGTVLLTELANNFFLNNPC